VHFGQHDAELHAAGVIHLRADNVVIHVEATRGFRKQRRIDGWPVNSMRSIGTLSAVAVGFRRA
jgi:hypothetical protein